MKTLSNYTEEKITALINKTGAFFAFSDTQFKEQQKNYIKYVSLGAGLICPKNQAKFLLDALKNITKEGIQEDIQDNGKENIIIRELYNYECFYTGNYHDAVDSLKDYNITAQEVKKLFYKQLTNVD